MGFPWQEHCRGRPTLPPQDHYQGNLPITIETATFEPEDYDAIENVKTNARERLLRLELALVFPEEEGMMQQSSVSISLSF